MLTVPFMSMSHHTCMYKLIDGICSICSHLSLFGPFNIERIYCKSTIQQLQTKGYETSTKARGQAHRTTGKHISSTWAEPRWARAEFLKAKINEVRKQPEPGTEMTDDEHGKQMKAKSQGGDWGTRTRNERTQRISTTRCTSSSDPFSSGSLGQWWWRCIASIMRTRCTGSWGQVWGMGGWGWGWSWGKGWVWGWGWRRWQV